MAISKDLLLAILSMDAYNRGYGAGINFGDNSDVNGTTIGSAKILKTKGDAAAQSAGFYAIAYEWNGQTVISYRGTDDPYDVDIANGYTIGAGVPGGPQSIMATDGAIDANDVDFSKLRVWRDLKNDHALAPYERRAA